MEMFADIEQWGLYLAAVLVALLAVVLPMSAYAAQKWAHKTYLEVRSINAKLTELLDAGGPARPPDDRETVSEPGPRQRREPTLGKNHGGATASGLHRARTARSGDRLPQ